MNNQNSHIAGLMELPSWLQYKMTSYINDSGNKVMPPSGMTIHSFDEGYVIQTGDQYVCSMKLHGRNTTVFISIVPVKK